VIALVVAALLAAGGEPLGFESHVDPKQVQLGQPLVDELVITHRKEERYELKTPSDLGPFELLEQTRSRVDGPDKATTTFRLKMSLFELGKKNVPDLTFDVFDENGSHTFVAHGPEVEAVSSLPANAEEKGEDLNDIKPNVDVPTRSYRLLWSVLIALAVAGLVYAGFRWWNRPRPVAAPPPKPREPLHVRTIAALDQLRKEDLPGQGRIKEHYFRLSEILRGYLGERYGFDAMECTSSELFESLRTLHTPGLPTERLRAFSDEADLVKFAKAEVGRDACKGALEFGYQLVSLTMPQPPLPPLPSHASGPRAS
jgi:hypothetical protein